MDLIISIVLGFFTGIITGLTPGLHVNTIIAFLTLNNNNESTAFFILTIALAHTFFDTIPTIFLGAPDTSQVLSILPGHYFLLEGKGIFALRSTVIGSFFGLIISIILIPLLIIIINIIKNYLDLIFFIIFFFFIFETKKYDLIFFILSGIIGFYSWNNKVSLFSLLSGFFGIGSLLLINNNQLPKQIIEDKKKTFYYFFNKKTKVIYSLLKSIFASFLTALLPGFGSSAAASLVTLNSNVDREEKKKNKKENNKKKEEERIFFLLMSGSISTVNFSLSLLTWFLLDKARNGAVLFAKNIIKLNKILLIKILLLFIILGFFASIIILFFDKYLILITKLNQKKLALIIITIIISFSAINGLKEIITLIISSIIGYLGNKIGIARRYLMGSLLIPVFIKKWF